MLYSSMHDNTAEKKREREREDEGVKDGKQERWVKQESVWN